MRLFKDALIIANIKIAERVSNIKEQFETGSITIDDYLRFLLKTDNL